MSPTLEQALRKAGWHPGRRTREAFGWETSIRQSGRALPDEVREALFEFGGLRLEVSSSGFGKTARRFGLDPSVPEEDVVRQYEIASGRVLTPLGFIEGGLYYLVADVSGSIYALIPPGLEEIGQNILDALERLVRNERGRVEVLDNLAEPEDGAIYRPVNIKNPLE